MANLEKQQIVNMGWSDFAERFEVATRDVKGSAPDEKPFREYFGDEEFELLQRMARVAKDRRGRAGAELGTVIVLPGIMGSSLVAVKNGVKEDLVWVDYLGLATGQMEQLRLTPDGRREFHTQLQVRASAIDKRVYARIVTMLRGRWDVQAFAFDWRKDLDLASDALATFIKERYPGKPVHLVAHSMGGLVGRNFIRRHRDVWESLSVDGRGGRFVMLGTPNFGSFDIPQVLTGEEKLVRMLSKLDLRHDLDDLLGIIGTFVGAYLMLPSPAKIPALTQEIYQRSTWGAHPVSEAHLKRAKEFHLGLSDEATISPERMLYIAGSNRRTLSGLEIQGPGRFAYRTTFNGDGRVTHELGLLNGVPTYYADEVHGDLPRNEKVIEAVDQLLENGRTIILPMQPAAERAAIAGEGTWYRPIREYQLGSQLERFSRQATRQMPDPESLRLAEEALVRAAAGAEPRVPRQVPARQRAEAVKPRKVLIEVAYGDITRVPAPVVVVGHYKGVTPINAIGAIDKCLDGWIKYAAENSILGGDLGQLFFIPVREKQIAADGVLVVGMGQEGKFNLHDLSYLMHNVVYGITTLKMDSFATVLIGAGPGSLPEDKALRFMLDGICEGLDRVPQDAPPIRVILVEINEERHKRLYGVLKRLAEEEAGRNTEITVESKKYETAGDGRAWEGRREAGPQERFGPRLTIERDGDVIRYSALTRQSVVPAREVELQSFYQEGIAERLMSAQTRDEQEMFGRLLNTSLLPEDFQEFYDTTEPLTLILDRSTARFPWEMSCFLRRSGPAFFGPDLKLTRQFRTLLSPAPGIAPQLNDRLRVLVIADPARDDLHLEGAQREGEEVVRLFSRVKRLYDLDIEVIDRIGPAECEPIEILALVLNGDFDIIHFAGHGVFDENKPNRSGWVFGRDKENPEVLRILSAREIFRARWVPRLVFSNACFSAVVNRGKALSADEMNRNLAGLAEAFFERGVQNYVGAGWPVADGPAVTFAKEFYARAITGHSEPDLNSFKASDALRPEPKVLGEALAEARRRILYQGSTWGAYHHYGDAAARLVDLKAKLEEARPEGQGRPIKKAKKRARARGK